MEPYVRLAGLSLMLPPDWLAVLAEVGDGLLDMMIEAELSVPEDLGFIHTPWMDASVDPYARLATLLWILKPADVARLVEVADGLAEQRLVAFLGSAGSGPGQATPRPQNRS